jgi:hypothetical protein
MVQPVVINKFGFYDTMQSFLLNMYNGDATGRLLEYDPEGKTTRVLIEGLWFSNGVAIDPAEEYVLVVETNGFRVIKHWLKGAKKGESENLIEYLPGFPDGISRSVDGNFWVSLVAPYSPLLPLAAKSKLLRYVLGWVPLPKSIIKKWGCVIKISPAGEILQVLLDPDGDTVSSISATTEIDGLLLFGNLGGNFVSFLETGSSAA